MDPEPNQFGIIHFATSLVLRPKQRSKLMNQNHVMSFTKTELELLFSVLDDYLQWDTIKPPTIEQGQVLLPVIQRIDKALTVQSPKEIWPRDWPRDIETIGAK